MADITGIGNRIPYERRNRLNELGVNWREIPIEKFLFMDSSGKESLGLVGDSMQEDLFLNNKKTPSLLVGTQSQTQKVHQDFHKASPVSYILFIEQSKLFAEHLKEIHPPIHVTVDGRNVNPHNPGNWFTCFAPISWGRKVPKGSSGPGSGFGSGVGVGYGFTYTSSRDGSPFIRLSNGVENPFKHKFRDCFRNDVSMAIRSRNISLPPACLIWPGTRFPDFRFRGTSILECQPIPLKRDTWEKVLDNYKILTRGYNDTVAQLVRKYYADGAFEIEF